MFTFLINNYNYRLKFSFDQDKIATEETDFPVLIKLDSTNFDFTKVKFSGRDIVFVMNDNVTLLEYERVKYDYENEEAEFWVKLPLTSLDQRFIFYMYFGNFYHIQNLSSKDVWDNDYSLVYHGQKKVVVEPLNILSNLVYFFGNTRESLMKGELSLADNMKAMLLNDYTPDLENHEMLADVSEYEISPSKYYSEGGIELENISFSRTNDIISWSADSTVLQYIEDDVNCLVVYKDDVLEPYLLFLLPFLCEDNEVQSIHLDATAVVTVDWDLQIQINPAYVQAPTITYPIEDQENVPVNAEIQSSDFATVKQADDHVASEWQIYHDGELIHTSNEDPENLLTYISPYNEVPFR
jgi:hypothetical protein